MPHDLIESRVDWRSVSIGATRDEVVERLGIPHDTGSASRKYQSPGIYKYDEIEFHFEPGKDGRLVLNYTERIQTVTVSHWHRDGHKELQQGKTMARVGIIVEKIYEDLELQYPKYRLKEAGHTVDVIGPKAGETYVGKHGYPQKAEVAAADVQANDYQLIVIPGGTSPDHMRRSEHVVKLARDADKAQIPMAAICHGPWLLCSTKALRGRRCTSYMSIVSDVLNAGGKWVDEACVVDGHVITSRTPEDLPAFMSAVLSLLKDGHADGTKGEPAAPAWVHQLVAEDSAA